MERSPGLQDRTPPEDRWPKVAVIILNWNGWRDTIECLESLQRVIYPNYQVIIVDNGSTDDSLEKIKAWAKGELPTKYVRYEPSGKPIDLVFYCHCEAEEGDILEEESTTTLHQRLIVIQSGANLGFAEGNNVGIRYALASRAGFEYICLLNNDTIVEPDFLTHLVQCAEEDHKIGIAGCLVKTLDGKRITGAGVRFPFDELFIAGSRAYYLRPAEYYSVDASPGTGMLVQCDLLKHRKAVSGYYFDPALFIYCEELDLCLWARRHGYKVIMVKNAIVYHKCSASSGGSGSPLSYYYVTRNRMRVASAYLPVWLKVAFHLWYPLSRAVRVIQKLLEGRSDVASAILEGLLAGYRGVSGKWRHHPI